MYVNTGLHMLQKTCINFICWTIERDEVNGCFLSYKNIRNCKIWTSTLKFDRFLMLSTQ